MPAPLHRATVTSSESTMRGFVGDIETQTTQNRDFRRVLYTGSQMQLVLMAIEPGGEIGEEVHEDIDQFFRVEQGTGEVLIDGRRSPVTDGTAIVVPSGAKHNVKNTGDSPLLLYTLYAPPHHEDGTVQHTKAEADASEEHFTGQTTE